MELKEEVFSEMNLKLYEQQEGQQDQDVTIDENLNSIENLPPTQQTPSTQPTYNYDYIGYLSIPKIGFKRGFVSKDSKYNRVDYNIALAKSSSFPDQKKGNLIIMGHSGYGYNAYFANLHQIEIGDQAIVTYKNKEYTYQLVKIDIQEKTGKLAIFRDFDKTTLTLITCTYQDDYHQSIYIFEQI